MKAPRQEPAGARTEPQLRGPTAFCGHTASGAWSGRGRGFLSTSTGLRWLSSVTAPSTTHHCQPESRPVGKLPRRPSGWHPTLAHLRQQGTQQGGVGAAPLAGLRMPGPSTHSDVPGAPGDAGPGRGCSVPRGHGQEPETQRQGQPRGRETWAHSQNRHASWEPQTKSPA